MNLKMIKIEECKTTVFIEVLQNIHTLFDTLRLLFFTVKYFQFQMATHNVNKIFSFNIYCEFWKKEKESLLKIVNVMLKSDS